MHEYAILLSLDGTQKKRRFLVHDNYYFHKQERYLNNAISEVKNRIPLSLFL